MRTCEFSEFSFGFALTDSLVKHFTSVLGVAPVFPNQIAEGKDGGGFDMKLPLDPLPVYFQFKIPQVMVRSSSLKPASFSLPYYRMALRTASPNQHKLLLDLDKKGSLVYYASPHFHRVAKLDAAFLAKAVHQDCAFIRPRAVGPLDEKSHHINYQRGASFQVRSEPKEIGSDHSFEDLLADMKEHAGGKQLNPTSTDRRVDVLNEVRNWLANNRRRDRTTDNAADDSLLLLLNRRHESLGELARDLGYVAQVHYGLEIAFIDASLLRSQNQTPP